MLAMASSLSFFVPQGLSFGWLEALQSEYFPDLSFPVSAATSDLSFEDINHVRLGYLVCRLLYN